MLPSQGPVSIGAHVTDEVDVLVEPPTSGFTDSPSTPDGARPGPASTPGAPGAGRGERIPRPGLWNLPNSLTMLRLALSVVLFTILWWSPELTPAAAKDLLSDPWIMLHTAFAIFIVAAITDIVDGQVARRYKQETDFGRIADPFADKIIVCGCFVLLTSYPEGGVQPWMAVVILAREFLVNGIRSYAESRGIAFPADRVGKMKMLSQCIAVGSILFYLGHWPRAGLPAPAWAWWTITLSLWGAVIVTILSGVLYVKRATSLLSNHI